MVRNKLQCNLNAQQLQDQYMLPGDTQSPVAAPWPVIHVHCTFSFQSQIRSQRSEIGCLLYFHTWCGLSANLEYMSEMCYTRLAENKGRKKSLF